MTARAVLLDILGAEVDPFVAEKVLDLLDDNRSELVDWLTETELLTRTKWGLNRYPRSDSWGNPTEDLIAPGVVRDDQRHFFWVAGR